MMRVDKFIKFAYNHVIQKCYAQNAGAEMREKWQKRN